MTARADRDVDETARLDGADGPAAPSVQQIAVSLCGALRAADGGEVVGSGLPVGDTVQLDLATNPVSPPVARPPGGRDRVLARGMLRKHARGGPMDGRARGDTVLLDVPTAPVSPSAAPPRRHVDVSARNVSRAHGRAGAVAGRAHPIRPVRNGRLSRLNPSIPLLGILLALTATLRLVNLTGSPARLDDEGTYMAQAYAVTEWGELAHYTYWYDHPPAGWLQLALWTAISGPDFGGSSVAAGRYLMATVAVVTAALLWAIARRIDMSRWAAAAAVTIFALSPLAISLSRTVYLDNLAVAWVLGALVLLCSPRYRLSAMFGAATCFGIAVLTKETMLLLLPMFAWLVWTRTAAATRRYALAVFVAVFGVVVSTYLLMAVLRNELFPGPGHVSLWDGIGFQLWDRISGGTLDDPYSLKRHTVDEWLKLDPALPILAVPIALAALFVERLRPFAIGLAILVAVVFRPGYLPVPFILAALPLAALLAAGTGEVVCDICSAHLRDSDPPACGGTCGSRRWRQRRSSCPSSSPCGCRPIAA
jgi:Dolichyl-phosphate-mannose-protein mannosyltransferase